MSATETLARNAVKAAVEAEFSAEGYTVTNDKLTRAAGKDGDALAVSPDASYEDPRYVGMLITQVLLQVYLKYDPTPDENITVDPSDIEAIAGRLRHKFRTSSQGTGGDFWWLRLIRIDFPDDPTGNKSRLEATFEVRADNEAGLPV